MAKSFFPPLVLCCIITVTTIWAKHHHHHKSDSSSSSASSSSDSDYYDYGSSGYRSYDDSYSSSDEEDLYPVKKLKVQKPKCHANEVFSQCSSMCEPQCGQHVMGRPCIDMCGPPKCQCKKGFVRNNDSGKCVLSNQCPVECTGQNEMINQCGGCEATCANPRPICPMICSKPKCRCAQGFVRGPSGICILESDCPASNSTCSKPNEEYKECSTCEGTCDNPSSICTMECRPSSCQCKSNFVRNIEGDCVRKTECNDACARVHCSAGTQCTIVQVQCIRAPCPPIAQCVPILNAQNSTEK